MSAFLLPGIIIIITLEIPILEELPRGRTTIVSALESSVLYLSR